MVGNNGAVANLARVLVGDEDAALAGELEAVSGRKRIEFTKLCMRVFIIWAQYGFSFCFLEVVLLGT